MQTRRFTRRTAMAIIGATGLSAAIGDQVVSAQTATPFSGQNDFHVWMRRGNPAATRFVPGSIPTEDSPYRQVVSEEVDFGFAYESAAGILRDGDTIYLAGQGAPGSDVRSIFAVDTVHSEILWHLDEVTDLLAISDSRVIVRRWSDNEHAFIIVAFDRDTGSKELWSLKLPVQRPPIVIGDLLLISSVAHTTGIDLASGEQRWVFPRPDRMGFAPRDLAVTSEIAVASEPFGHSNVIAFSIADATTLWRIDIGALVLTGPIIVNDRVYVATEEELVALELATGKEMARIPLDVPINSNGGLLAANQNHLFVCSTDGFAALTIDGLESAWYYRASTWLHSSLDFTLTDTHAIVRANNRVDDYFRTVFDVIDLATGLAIATYPSREDEAEIDREYAFVSIGRESLAFATRYGLILQSATSRP